MRKLVFAMIATSHKSEFTVKFNCIVVKLADILFRWISRQLEVSIAHFGISGKLARSTSDSFQIPSNFSDFKSCWINFCNIWVFEHSITIKWFPPQLLRGQKVKWLAGTPGIAPLRILSCNHGIGSTPLKVTKKKQQKKFKNLKKI